MGDVGEAQGRGQAVLGGGNASEAPSWRGQPGQGTEGKPGQRPAAATGPRAEAYPASRKGLPGRRYDGQCGERVRGSSNWRIGRGSYFASCGIYFAN